MTALQRNELLNIIGMALIVVAVLFGGLRHTNEIDNLRQMLEIDASSHVADIEKVQRKVDRIKKHIDELCAEREE